MGREGYHGPLYLNGSSTETFIDICMGSNIAQLLDAVLLFLGYERLFR